MKKQDAFTFYIKWFVLLFPLIAFNSKQINASVDSISEKFSRNQLQFERAVSDLHLRFSDEAVARLKSNLDTINEIIKTRKQIKKAKTQLQTLEVKFGNLDDENTPFKVDLPSLPGVRNYSKEERRIVGSLLVPSREEWLTERYRDWGLLGEEIITIYNDLFKDSMPSKESFEQLAEKAIENILSQDHFIWFDMNYPSYPVFSSLYASYRERTRNGSTDRDRKDYSNELKEQVLHVLFNTLSVPGHLKKVEAKNPFDYITLGFTLKTNPSIDKDLDYYLRLNFFYLLTNEGHLKTLFETESRRQSAEVFLRKAENLKSTDSRSAEESILQEWKDFIMPQETEYRKLGLEFDRLSGKWVSDLDGFSWPWGEKNLKQALQLVGADISLFSHIPKAFEKKYKALKEVFEGCYSHWPVSKLHLPARRDLTAPNFDNNVERELSLFASESHSLDHPDSYCRTIGAIFRQIYFENELELYKQYVAKSGKFYDMGIKLRAAMEYFSNQYEEVSQRVQELKAKQQKELDKDNSIFRLIGFGSDPETLQSIQSDKKEAEKEQSLIYNKLRFVELSLHIYKRYSHSEALRHEEDVKTKLESFSDQLEEAETRLAQLEEEYQRTTKRHESRNRNRKLESLSSQIAQTRNNVWLMEDKKSNITDVLEYLLKENQRRMDIATAHIELLEPLALRYRSDYEKAEMELASLSPEETYEKIEEEWSRTAIAFFNSLSEKSREYKKTVSIKNGLQTFIRQIRNHVSELETHLANLEEKVINPSPIRKKYLELKIKLISDIMNDRPPQLADVFNGLLLQHYQPIGKSLSSFNSFLRDLNKLSEGGASVPVDSFKTIYEEEIANTYHQGWPLMYNKKFSSLTHPIKENRVQCYSGSMLFSVLTELAGLTSHPRFALFTTGHILPGLLGDKEELLGIETTAAGQGLVNFGPVSEISGQIQVVELYPFLLIEFLKAEISNFPELYAATQTSLKKYGFVTENLRTYDPNRSGKPGKTQTPGNFDILNASPFGFGSANVPSGDWERSEVTNESLLFYDLSGENAASKDKNESSSGAGDINEEKKKIAEEEFSDAFSNNPHDFFKQPVDKSNCFATYEVTPSHVVVRWLLCPHE